MVFKSEVGGCWLDLSGSSVESFFSDETESAVLMVDTSSSMLLDDRVWGL